MHSLKWMVGVFVFLISLLPAQNFVFEGHVLDKQTHAPIKNAQVRIADQLKVTDTTGYFKFELTAGSYDVWVVAEGYISVQNNILLNKDTFYSIELERQTMNDNVTETLGIQEMDLENDNNTQNISGLLSASKDVFGQFSSFSWSSLRYKYRGYDVDFHEVYVNGLPMQNYERGYINYAEFAGLNRVLRFKEYAEGALPAAYAMGGIAGMVNYFSTAGQIPKQIHLSLARSNRSYNNRIMLTYATGMQSNGWAVATLFSKRWAEVGHVPGTFLDAYSYFLSFERKLNKQHQLAFTLMGSPYRRGLQAAATDEAFDLAGDVYYNPNWGYQEGKVRNARVRNVHIPFVMLNHTWILNEKNKVYTVLGWNGGRYGTTRLNWYNAPDPRPDYYRYMPSYQTDTLIAQMIADKWRNHVEVRQIDWNQLYQINYLSNLTSGGRANYILEEERKDVHRFSMHSYLHSILSEKIILNAGLDATFLRTHHFKVLDDLLGAEFWVDVDQYAERDFPGNPNILQNDLNHPNAKVKEGDIFGYDYYLHTNVVKTYGLARFYYKKVDLFAALEGGVTQAFRDGMMRNGRYPDNSFGKSAVKYFPLAGLKAGATYKLTGKHYFRLTTTALYLPQVTSNLFISPNISNGWIPVLTNMKVLSGDITYFYRGHVWNGRVGLYQTFLLDQTDLVSFYHDVYQTFVNVVMWGIDKVYQGIELGLEVNILPQFTLQGAANIGNYRFISRPTAHINVENQSKPDTTELVYLKYFYVPNEPQSVYSVGVKYSTSNNWFATLTVNHARDIYMDINPERRMQSALDGLAPSQADIINSITQQGKLNDITYVDFSLGKQWRFKMHQIGMNLMINNLLNKKYKTTGFEQYRFDFTGKNINKFPPKYYYGWGRNYFIQLTFSL